MSARKDRTEQAVAESARKALDDRRYNWLRTPRARTMTAIAAIAVIALVPAAYVIDSSFGLVFVGATFVMWVALRLTVRTVADLPDSCLDERQRAVRDAAYREAFIWLAGVATLLASAALVAFLVRSSDDALTITLTWDTLFPWTWVVIAASMTLPSIVIALRDREFAD